MDENEVEKSGRRKLSTKYQNEESHPCPPFILSSSLTYLFQDVKVVLNLDGGQLGQRLIQQFRQLLRIGPQLVESGDDRLVLFFAFLCERG